MQYRPTLTVSRGRRASLARLEVAQECDESSEYVTVELKKIGFEGPDDLTESLEYITCGDR